MALANAYQIATTLPGLATLESLGVTVPRSEYQPYTEAVSLGDGTVRGAGAPFAKWLWDYLPQDQRDILRTYCTDASAEIYIETRTVDTLDVWDQFSAVMVWPTQEQRENFVRLEFAIEFRYLVAA